MMLLKFITKSRGSFMDNFLYGLLMFIAVIHASVSWLLRLLRIISLETFQRLTLVECDATDRGSLRKVFKSYFDYD